MQSLWKIGWRFLEKLKTELPHDSSPTPGHIYPEKTRVQKDTCTPVSTAAPRQGSNLHVHQPVNGYRWMDKEDVVQIYSGIILSHKSEWNNAIYSNMSGPRNCDAEWSKSEKDKYHIVSLICGVLKKDTNELIYKT